MKKRLVVLAGLVSTLWATSAFAALDRVRAFEVAFQTGLHTQSDSNEKDLYLGGGFSYGLSPTVAVGVSTGWAHGEIGNVISGIPSQRVDAGKMTIVPLFLDVYLRSAPQSLRIPTAPASFYGLVGIGTIFTDVETEQRANNVVVTADDDWALKLGVGVDFLPENSNWVINLEGAYVFTAATLEARDGATGVVTDEQELDFWLLTAGLKYRFA